MRENVLRAARLRAGLPAAPQAEAIAAGAVRRTGNRPGSSE
jgi:hypothetical protein